MLFPIPIIALLKSSSNLENILQFLIKFGDIMAIFLIIIDRVPTHWGKLEKVGNLKIFFPTGEKLGIFTKLHQNYGKTGEFLQGCEFSGICCILRINPQFDSLRNRTFPIEKCNIFVYSPPFWIISLICAHVNGGENVWTGGEKVGKFDIAVV